MWKAKKCLSSHSLAPFVEFRLGFLGFQRRCLWQIEDAVISLLAFSEKAIACSFVCAIGI